MAKKTERERLERFVRTRWPDLPDDGVELAVQHLEKRQKDWGVSFSLQLREKERNRALDEIDDFFGMVGGRQERVDKALDMFTEARADKGELTAEQSEAIAAAVEEHGQEAVDDLFQMLDARTEGSDAGSGAGPLDEYGSNEAARNHSAWGPAYNGALDEGFSDEVAEAMADEAVHQALFEEYRAQGFSDEVALAMANEDVPSAVPEDKRGERVDRFDDGADASGGDSTGDSTGDTGGDSTEPPDEIVTDEDIANLAAAYGYGARWLNHEELGPILRQAAEEGWYDNATGQARLEAAIKGTDWWDNHDANERNHQLLEASDPAEAERLLDLQVDRLQRAAGQLGLAIADDRVREIARAAHVENWSDYEINQNMLLEAEWAPGQAGGEVADYYSVIDAHAGDYMVGHLIDDTTKDEWARALYLGDATEMGIRNDIAALAQSAFPSMDNRIGQGYTARQILSPLRQEAARLLEIDASSIDLMTDPRFQPIWQQQNDDGTTRVMSVAEVGQYVRGLDDWQTTKNATDEAHRFAEFIGKKFGKAA